MNKEKNRGIVSTFNKTNTIVAIVLIVTIALGGVWWIYKPSTLGSRTKIDTTDNQPTQNQTETTPDPTNVISPEPNELNVTEPEPEPEPETPPTDSDIIEITMSELVEKAINHIQNTNKEEYESLIGKTLRLTDAIVRKKEDQPVGYDDYWLVLELNEEIILTVFVGFDHTPEFKRILDTIQVGDQVTVEGEFDRTYPIVGAAILTRTPQGMKLAAVTPLGRILYPTKLIKQSEP